MKIQNTMLKKIKSKIYTRVCKRCNNTYYVIGKRTSKVCDGCKVTNVNGGVINNNINLQICKKLRYYAETSAKTKLSYLYDVYAEKVIEENVDKNKIKYYKYYLELSNYFGGRLNVRAKESARV